MKIIDEYKKRLSAVLSNDFPDTVLTLCHELLEAWNNKRSVFLCGNGGSAANAIHLANDFNYGIDRNDGFGLPVEALTANSSVLTCLANDEGYDMIFSQQLKVKANPKDVLIIFSGSGESQNVVNALEIGNNIGMKTFAVIGYSGGKCKRIAQYPIHFAVDDMQISEDLQLIVGHMCMQWLLEKGKGKK